MTSEFTYRHPMIAKRAQTEPQQDSRGGKAKELGPGGAGSSFGISALQSDGDS